MKSGVGAEPSDGPLAEKWLVAFRNPASKRDPGGSVFVRQFFAPGYYEAYDMVITHAERNGLEVLWFREKRSCEPFLNKSFPGLESTCTYCNKKFNHSDPIPCVSDGCRSQFCSKECEGEHSRLRH
ncbi:MAG TPA: hypothetical protein VJL54_05020 [Nitrososphaera sp.]|nr:hypothetical protein [Nitrososphaera sp.]